MFGDDLRDAKSILKRFMASLDPEVLEPATAAKLVEEFGEIERLGAAGRALAAGRVASSGAWRKEGDRSAAHWLAKKSGTTVGEAVSTIETAQRLEDLPRTMAAVKEGRLSQVQAKEIAAAAAAAPSRERELLEVANKEGVATLRETCAKVKASANKDEIERYRKIQRERFLRYWSDPEGAFRLEAKLTPHAGAMVIAALEPYKQKAFQDARAQGRRDNYQAYAADALAAMAKDARVSDKKASRRSPGTLVRVLVGHEALKRGHTEDGEVCVIEGVGPIPVATAKALAQDSILAALITNGTDIKTVSHLGASVTARQRTALEVRDPCCVVPGCEVKDHLEIDHITGRVGEGARIIDNLARLCPHHHDLKTYQGYTLTGGPGNWKFEPP